MYVTVYGRVFVEVPSGPHLDKVGHIILANADYLFHGDNQVYTEEWRLL